MFFNRRMDRQTVVCLYNRLLFGNKKERIIDSHNNMDELKWTSLSEISKSLYIVWFHLYNILKKVKLERWKVGQCLIKDGFERRGDYKRIEQGSFGDDGTNLLSILINSLPLYRAFWCWLLRTEVVHLFSDSSKLFFVKIVFLVMYAHWSLCSVISAVS